MQFERRARIGTRLDIAPLVDVVFLLLLFFLLTSSYVVHGALDITLPASTTSEALADQALVVTVAADGSVRIEGEAIAADELAAAVGRLLARRSTRSVVLQADAAARVQRLVTVLDALREAGAGELALTTVPGAPPP